MKLTGDGSTLVATAPDHGDGAGAVWRYDDLESQFYFSQKLVTPDNDTDDALRQRGLAMTKDGLILAVAAEQDDEVANNAGAVYVWQLNGTEGFDYSQKLLALDGQSSDLLGHGGPALTDDGRLLAAAAHTSATNSGSVYMWLLNYSTNQYEFLQKLMSPEPSSGDYLGKGGPSFAANGILLAAAASGEQSSSGSFHVWKLNATSSYNYEGNYKPPDVATNDFFGLGGLTFARNGTTVIGASPYEDSSTITNIGAVYIWKSNCG